MAGIRKTGLRSDSERAELRDAIVQMIDTGENRSGTARRLHTSQDVVRAVLRGDWDHYRSPETGRADPWQVRGNCRDTDPDTFFPEKGRGSRAAKNVCTGCPVKGQCLEFALVNGLTHGVWGGLTGPQRARLKPVSAGQEAA